MAPRGSFNVVLEGRGALTLSPTDHVATGGEGSVYRVRDIVVKIYNDPKKMQRENMAGKLALLTSLSHPSIAAPQGVVRGSNGQPIGFFMPWVEGEPLPMLFPNDIRAQIGFGDDESSILVAHMRDAMEYAHTAGALMVDPNELNWIVTLTDPKRPIPRVIDVDSWAIGTWPATVIMPSIRDLHRPGFDHMTDWFAWGIVTFQVYTGIHPYKGTVPGFGRYDLAARMQANASVFRPDARVNKAVRPWNVIPGKLLDWYVAAFEQGVRTAPPSPFDTGVGTVRPARTLRIVTTAAGALVYAKLFERAGDRAVRVFPCGLVRLESGDVVDVSTARTIAQGTTPMLESIRVADGWLLADRAATGLSFVYVDGRSGARMPLTHTISGQRIVTGAERMFAVTERGLTEVLVRKLGQTVLLAPGKVWGVLPHALSWYRGVGVLDALGAAYVVLPVGNDAVAEVRIPQLDGVRIVAGVGHGRIATLVGVNASGDYTRFDLLFASDMRTARVDVSPTSGALLDQTILPKGVVAEIEDDGELRITVPTTGTVNRVADKDIATDMLLARIGDQVVYLKDGALWSLRMQ